MTSVSQSKKEAQKLRGGGGLAIDELLKVGKRITQKHPLKKKGGWIQRGNSPTPSEQGGKDATHNSRVRVKGPKGGRKGGENFVKKKKLKKLPNLVKKKLVWTGPRITNLGEKSEIREGKTVRGGCQQICKRNDQKTRKKKVGVPSGREKKKTNKRTIAKKKGMEVQNVLFNKQRGGLGAQRCMKKTEGKNTLGTRGAGGKTKKKNAYRELSGGFLGRSWLRNQKKKKAQCWENPQKFVVRKKGGVYRFGGSEQKCPEVNFSSTKRKQGVGAWGGHHPNFSQNRPQDERARPNENREKADGKDEAKTGSSQKRVCRDERCG